MSKGTDKVVYPTSPLTVVPTVMLKVLESTPKLAAAQRSGVVAANVIIDHVKPMITKILHTIILENLVHVFIIMY